MKITNKHKTAITLILDGHATMEEIAARVNVSRRTLYNWLEDDDFMDALRAAEEEIDARIRRRISGMVDRALSRQEAILHHGNDNAAAIVAKDVLDRAGYMPEDNINLKAVGPVQIIDDIPRD